MNKYKHKLERELQLEPQLELEREVEHERELRLELKLQLKLPLQLDLESNIRVRNLHIDLIFVRALPPTFSLISHRWGTLFVKIAQICHVAPFD